MKDFFKHYLSIHTREQNGLLFLSIIVFVLILANQFSGAFFSKNNISFKNYSKEIDAWLLTNKTDFNSYSDKKSSGKQFPKIKKSQIEKFNFDPNIASEDELKRLGFSKFSIKNIMNYRSHNGRFKEKKDLKKVYGIDEKFYSSIENYIVIQTIPEGEKKQFSATESNLVNINNSDSIQLNTLPGIGPKLSSRIIKYRNRLGGFITKSQLKEVYGITEETYALIETKIICEGLPNKILINQVSEAELKNHPYFSYNQVKAIINYRSKHGNFKSMEDIKSTDLFNEEICTKIAPYIDFQ